jgi:hypothetical protein
MNRMISGADEEGECEEYPSRYELYVPPPPPDLTEREIQALKDEVKASARQCEILIGRIIRERQRKAQYELRLQNISDLKSSGCADREARIISSDLEYWQNKVQEARESVKFMVANWQQFKDDLNSYVTLLEQAWGDGGLLAWATATICEFIEGRDPPGNLFRDFHSHREEMKHLRSSFFRNPKNPETTNKALRAAMESSLEKIQRSLVEFRKLINE